MHVAALRIVDRPTLFCGTVRSIDTPATFLPERPESAA